MSEALKRRRGRPVTIRPTITVESLARMLRLKPEALEALLVAGLVPDARLDPVDGWQIPESGVLAMARAQEEAATLDRALAQRLTVQDVAQCLRVPKSTVYSWLRLRDPRTKKALLPSHKVLGHVRILAVDVAGLPERWPSWATRRPSLFFEKSE
jgi:hypothetical protein